MDNNQLRFVLFTLSFMVLLYGLIGMTTPNLGALVRYKIPVMPFLLFSILICTNFDLLKKLMHFRNKKEADSVNSQTETMITSCSDGDASVSINAASNTLSQLNLETGAAHRNKETGVAHRNLETN